MHARFEMYAAVLSCLPVFEPVGLDHSFRTHHQPARAIRLQRKCVVTGFIDLQVASELSEPEGCCCPMIFAVLLGDLQVGKHNAFQMLRVDVVQDSLHNRLQMNRSPATCPTCRSSWRSSFRAPRRPWRCTAQAESFQSPQPAGLGLCHCASAPPGEDWRKRRNQQSCRPRPRFHYPIVYPHRCREKTAVCHRGCRELS